MKYSYFQIESDDDNGVDYVTYDKEHPAEDDDEFPEDGTPRGEQEADDEADG